MSIIDIPEVSRESFLFINRKYQAWKSIVVNEGNSS